MQFFTGLRFEVEQASLGLSAIAELLVNLVVKMALKSDELRQSYKQKQVGFFVAHGVCLVFYHFTYGEILVENTPLVFGTCLR